jgi:hypothetical protein
VEKTIMNRTLVLLVVIFAFMVSCQSIKEMLYIIYTPKVNIKEVIEQREKIDSSENPAYRYLISEKLSKKRIEVDDVIVKDIIPSSNIDYNFCIIVGVPYEKGEVECYIYARQFYGFFYGFYGKEDIETIAKLVKGKTRIDAVGDFARFFTLLDKTYTKIEIVNAKVTIKEEN